MTEHTSRGRPRKVSTPLSVTLREAANIAVRCIEELTGKPCNGATSVLPSDDGWTVEVELVEDQRIPPTTDILALYEIEIGSDGTVTSYQRIRRYGRGDKDHLGEQAHTDEPQDTGDTPPP